MSSRFRASARSSSALAALALAACDREERHSRSKPVGEPCPPAKAPTRSTPEPARRRRSIARAALYDNNAPAIPQGQMLYSQMNCVGCHSHGGGGMGPALMDDEWRYGGRIDQIAATIAEGRPNGMPAWRGKLTEDQIWKLAAYVRTLSGQPRKDACRQPRRRMSDTTPQTLTQREPAARRTRPSNERRPRAAAAGAPLSYHRLHYRLPEHGRRGSRGRALNPLFMIFLRFTVMYAR